MATIQYQWSIDGGEWKIGNDTYTTRAPSNIKSTITVACGVFIKLNSGVAVCGSDSVIIQPSGGKTLNYYDGYCIVANVFVKQLAS